MIHSQGFHQVVKNVLKVGNCRYFQVQNYDWSNDSRVKPRNNKYAGFLIPLSYFSIFILQFVQKGFDDLRWMAVHIYLSCMLLFVASVNIFHRRNRVQFASFMNGLFDLEDQMRRAPMLTSKIRDNGKMSSIFAKLIILFCKLLSLSFHGVAVCIAVLATIIPASPFNHFHSWMSEDMLLLPFYGVRPLSLRWAVMIAPAHYIMWRTGLVMVEVTCVLNYLTSLYSLFTWFQEYLWQMTNELSIRNLWNTSTNFRKLQILIGVYNHLHRQTIQLIFAISMSIAFTVCLYLSVKASGNGELIILAFSLIVTIDCGLGILLFFGLGAKVYSESKTVLEKLKWLGHKTCYRQSPWFRKLVASFPIQRIQIADGFFEPMTPLVIEQTCISNTISMLLVT